MNTTMNTTTNNTTTNNDIAAATQPKGGRAANGRRHGKQANAAAHAQRKANQAARKEARQAAKAARMAAKAAAGPGAFNEEKLRAVLMAKFDGDSAKVENVIARRKAFVAKKTAKAAKAAKAVTSTPANEENTTENTTDAAPASIAEAPTESTAISRKEATRAVKAAQRAVRAAKGPVTFNEDKMCANLTARFGADSPKVERIIARRKAAIAARAATAAQAAAAADEPVAEPTKEEEPEEKTAAPAPESTAQLSDEEKLKQILLIKFDGDEAKVERLMARRQRHQRGAGMRKHCFRAVPEDKLRSILLVRFDGDEQRVDRIMAKRAARNSRNAAAPSTPDAPASTEATATEAPKVTCNEPAKSDDADVKACFAAERRGPPAHARCHGRRRIHIHVVRPTTSADPNGPPADTVCRHAGRRTPAHSNRRNRARPQTMGPAIHLLPNTYRARPMHLHDCGPATVMLA